MRYFKQYGCKRTGTNYLRALLQRNFADVNVLMHTLGGKHEAPVDLKSLLNDYQDDPISFVALATQAHPAETTRPFDNEQLTFIKNNAVALADAVANNQIHYLISIKNPYAWINSNKDIYSWINQNYQDILNSHGGHTLTSRTELLTKLKCREFNSLYRSYFELYKKFPEQSTIIRYEDILANPAGFLKDLSEKLRLCPLSPIFSDVTGKTVATGWDQTYAKDETNEFSKEYYLKEKYIVDLPISLIDILENEIDWDLMKNYNYYRRKC